MKTFRFLDFSVYIKSKILYSKILDCTASLQVFTLKDQARRACLSIILNIAEGSAKKSDKDFARFLQISLGSINELYACIDIMKENKLIDLKLSKLLEVECADIAKELGGFTKKLRVTS
jgi:four helix bundle protein